MARVSQELGFRLNLMFGFLGSVCFFVLHLISFKFLISKFNFPGWSVGEAWVMLFTFEIFTYISFFVMWRGLTKTMLDIRTGGLDIILVKPIQSRSIAFFRSGGLHNLITVILGIMCLVWTFLTFRLTTSFLSILLYIASLFSGVWLLHCISVIIICINFYFEQVSGSDSFVYQFQEALKYPFHIYFGAPLFLRILIYLFAILTTLPSVVLLSKGVTVNLVMSYILFFIILTLASQFVWIYSLRHYSSASS
jgi:ABC-type uncharacterized transport system permease subunit